MKKMQLINTAKAVRRMRYVLGLTQAQLAGRMGVSTSAIKQWENALCAPSPENYKRIITFLEDESEIRQDEKAEEMQELLEAAHEKDINARLLAKYPAEEFAEQLTS